jgi:hypothetical protein
VRSPPEPLSPRARQVLPSSRLCGSAVGWIGEAPARRRGTAFRGSCRSDGPEAGQDAYFCGGNFVRRLRSCALLFVR